MSKRQPGYHRQSDAQLNAIALAQREAPYIVAHRASLVSSVGLRAQRGATLRDMTRHVIREFAMEAPAKLTDGLHHLDAGGVPEFNAEFLAYLESSPDATDRLDPSDATGVQDVIQVGFYRWPNRAALYLMVHSTNLRIRRLGYIVDLIVHGYDPVHAAITLAAHPDDAADTARRALSTFVGRRAQIKMHLPEEAN